MLEINNELTIYLSSLLLYLYTDYVTNVAYKAFIGWIMLAIIIANMAINFYHKCFESDDPTINSIVTNNQHNLKYKPANQLHFRRTNNTLLEQGKFLIFNKKKFRDGNGYVTNQ